jgi:tetratricopeptide (TPR) repeat protein
MKRITSIGLVLFSALAFGCGPSGSGPGGGPTAKDPSGKKIVDHAGGEIPQPAADKFKAGLDALAQHDKAKDWDEASCTSTANTFLDASKEKDKFTEAYYNAGLAYQRCKKTKEAKEQFQKALDIDPKFHPAKTQLVMLGFYEGGEKNLDQAISDMRQTAVVDAQYKNVEALVALAMLYMKRGNNVSDNDGANDYQRARRYLQSALAVDDGYMPAFNQLALFYLETAKQAAGQAKAQKTATNIGKKKRTDSQAMELADLVCSQAIRKNPNDPIIYNTMGMIQVELGNLNKAVEAFDKARQRDPNFYEAQMNFAAVNLQFRGFTKAEEAYRAVLKTRTNDYDAQLGLALALRGQINDSNFDQFVKESAEHLAKAKEIAPDRPETYYNEAILTQEYKTKATSDPSKAEPILLQAKDLFGQFVTKAGSTAEYADAVKRAKERIGEIDQIITFNKQTEKERKAAEADAKQKAAEAEASGANDESGGTGEAKPAPGGAAPDANKDNKPQ